MFRLLSTIPQFSDDKIRYFLFFLNNNVHIFTTITENTGVNSAPNGPTILTFDVNVSLRSKALWAYFIFIVAEIQNQFYH